MERYHGGFLVTDGHHNRVLRVGRNGSINEVATFGNVVPTGLEVTKHRVLLTQLGPIPHEPEDGKVLALRRRSEPIEIASGASMLIDVERGPHGKLYALSQGQWDGVGEGSPASPNTGRLVIVKRDGSLKPVVDRRRTRAGARPPDVDGVRRRHRIRRFGGRQRLQNRQPLNDGAAQSAGQLPGRNLILVLF